MIRFVHAHLVMHVLVVGPHTTGIDHVSPHDANLSEMLPEVEVDPDVDARAGDDDEEAPHVGEHITEIDGILLDPTPVPIDRVVQSKSERGETGDDREDPGRETEENLGRVGRVGNDERFPEAEEGDHRDQEDRTIRSLDVSAVSWPRRVVHRLTWTESCPMNPLAVHPGPSIMSW